MSLSDCEYDVIFAGGGLASCLTAYRLRQRQPDLKLLILEGASSLGGNHTWSFFPTDLNEAQLEWVEPLIVHRWSSYEVRFPALRRTLSTGYCSTHSEYFHTFMMGALGDCVQFRAPVESLAAEEVRIAGGETVRGRCVIDGRGPESSPHLMLGFQKFTGQVLNLVEAHGLTGPVIMDATVAQNGDYRFLYTLPTGPRQVLVEDTRYSNTPGMDAQTDAAAIGDYVSEQGWEIADVEREEWGALPITLGGEIDAFWAEMGDVPKIGLRAALFHATTGYSFADAVRTADAIAQLPELTTAAVRQFMERWGKRHWKAQGYWRFLNRMLFLAAEPDRRWFVMQRFYGLHQGLVERFYAGRSTLADKVRILTGKPPVAILRALKCLPESSASAHRGKLRRNQPGKEEIGN
ncbi:MAG: lycopene cyclase [Gammaproteobacteria bacterium]|nr:MAG: lycopene cyclase [Gammaproteobacteria bacterium]